MGGMLSPRRSDVCSYFYQMNVVIHIKNVTSQTKLEPKTPYYPLSTFRQSQKLM